MRRALLTSLLLLSLPAAAEASSAASSVRVVECVPAPDPQQRRATFEARMRATAGTERMQVRFTLQTREDDLQAWRKVAADGFDTWLTSMPAVSRYSYARTVVNLAAPAEYRTIVRFRWLDAGGGVVKSARDTSPSCSQPA